MSKISNAHNAVMMLSALVLGMLCIFFKIHNIIIALGLYLVFIMGALSWLIQDSKTVRRSNEAALELLDAQTELVKAKTQKIRSETVSRTDRPPIFGHLSQPCPQCSSHLVLQRNEDDWTCDGCGILRHAPTAKCPQCGEVDCEGFGKHRPWEAE